MIERPVTAILQKRHLAAIKQDSSQIGQEKAKLIQKISKIGEEYIKLLTLVPNAATITFPRQAGYPMDDFARTTLISKTKEHIRGQINRIQSASQISPELNALPKNIQDNYNIWKPALIEAIPKEDIKKKLLSMEGLKTEAIFFLDPIESLTQDFKDLEAKLTQNKQENEYNRQAHELIEKLNNWFTTRDKTVAPLFKDFLYNARQYHQQALKKLCLNDFTEIYLLSDLGNLDKAIFKSSDLSDPKTILESRLDDYKIPLD